MTQSGPLSRLAVGLDRNDRVVSAEVAAGDVDIIIVGRGEAQRQRILKREALEHVANQRSGIADQAVGPFVVGPDGDLRHGREIREREGERLDVVRSAAEREEDVVIGRSGARRGKDRKDRHHGGAARPGGQNGLHRHARYSSTHPAASQRRGLAPLHPPSVKQDSCQRRRKASILAARIFKTSNSTRFARRYAFREIPCKMQRRPLEGPDQWACG